MSWEAEVLAEDPVVSYRQKVVANLGLQGQDSGQRGIRGPEGHG